MAKDMMTKTGPYVVSDHGVADDGLRGPGGSGGGNGDTGGRGGRCAAKLPTPAETRSDDTATPLDPRRHPAAGSQPAPELQAGAAPT